MVGLIPRIDLIGDIHGHADELEALLRKLGYAEQNGAYAHPAKHQVIFLGDYIDRGPAIRRVLQVVKAMVDAGNAVALMGNHEYNALCYHTPDGKGGHLRPHTGEKLKQHAETLAQFKDDGTSWSKYLDWFRTLPLWFETEHFRAVHACWDPDHITLLKREVGPAGFTAELLHRCTLRDTPLFTALEETLKGKELVLPEGHAFKDKGGHWRKETRIRWWEHPAGKTFREHSVTQEADIPGVPVTDLRHAKGTYAGEEVPVFLGHYWLQQHHPAILAPNVCCLDHSVAKAGGRLMAYRFDGEHTLRAEKLVYVERMDQC